MTIAKIITYCFDKWWRPILFFGVTLALVVISELTSNHILGNISFVLLGFGLLALLISTIYQLTKKRWLKATVTIFIFAGTIAGFIMYSVFLFFTEILDGDKWADNLKIPPNIQLDNPIDLIKDDQRPDSILALTKSQTDFQLYNSFQPGLYQYDFWTGKIEDGTIYLKAFEITQEYALSTSKLPTTTAVKIYNTSNRIEKFGTISHFTIYEGDWGKPYAARFEVWFKPDSGGPELKLFVKNYKIEGWQR